MNRTLSICFLLMAAIYCTVGCTHTPKADKTFNQFTNVFTLEGTAIASQDTTVRLFGKAYACDSAYVFFIYDSPYFMSASDNKFMRFRDFGKKGEGPGELRGASLSGYDADEGTYRVYDSYANKIYTVSLDTLSTLHEVIRFPETYNRLNPIRVVELSDGTFVGARGDFRYGLVSYDPKSEEVEEWPVGGGFSISEPVSDEVSMRVVQYNKDRGIIAEIYGSCPDVILHREDGTISSRLRYSSYDRKTDRDGKLNDCFNDMVLSENYIWLLYTSEDESGKNKVFCLDYEGNPVAELIIDATSTIAVDERERRLLAIDPNDDEKNLVIYPLPDLLFD